MRLDIRQAVEDVDGLVHPAALLPRLGVHLLERRPEPHRAVAHRQLRRPREAALPHPQQHLAPALRRLPDAVLDRQEALLAAGVDANHHQHAQPPVVSPQAAVDAVRPQIHPLVVRRAPAPTPALLVPHPLQTAHHVRRQPPRRLLAHQRRNRRPHLPRRHPVQVQPRHRRVHARRAPHVRRHHRRAERRRRTLAAARLRHPHVNRADPRQHLPLGKVAVAHHALAAVRELLFLERRQMLLELRRHRRLDQLPGAAAKKVGEGIGNRRWRRQRDHIIVVHVRCAPLAGTGSSNSISAEARRTTQLIRTPLSTIALPRTSRPLRGPC